MTPVVRLDKLTKIYHQGHIDRVVLREVDEAFPAGTFTAIRGRSGTGKTTLLNLMAGLDTPTSGAVVVNGHDLAGWDDRRRTLFRRENVGFVFQFFNLIPTLTVQENVELPLELGGRLDRAGRARAAALLTKVGLADRAGEFPDLLSGGEQQRVAIARALVHEPRIVLADEPTGNLDRSTGEAVMDLLQSLTRATGRTLILVTHSASLASRADRVLTIEDGRLIPDPAFHRGPSDG